MLLRGIYNCILNMMFRGSHYEHSYWIRQSSGSSLSMYYTTMKLSSFLIIILGFTLRKSLAGLVISSSSDKYDEFSIVKAAVSIFFKFYCFQTFKVQYHINLKFFSN